MTRSRPLAVLVSGAPGSGKSTVGAVIAQRLGAALLDLDTATAALTRVVGDLRGTHDLDDPDLVRVTRAARYDAITALAEDNLAIGVDVVLVAPFSTERRDPAAWDVLRSRLEQGGATSRLVWLRISADEVGRRVERRGLARDAAKHAGSWTDGLDLEAPAVPHIEADAVLSPAAIAEHVLPALSDSVR